MASKRKLKTTKTIQKAKTTFARGRVGKGNNKATRVDGSVKKPRGRPRGIPNKYTGDLKHNIMQAAIDIGYNGKGKDGLLGYLKFIAWKEPKSFVSLLGRVLPLQLTGTIDVNLHELSRDEVVKRLEERGLPVQRLFALPAPPADYIEHDEPKPEPEQVAVQVAQTAVKLQEAIAPAPVAPAPAPEAPKPKKVQMVPTFRAPLRGVAPPRDEDE